MPAVVRFGAFELDRQSGELTRSGRSVHLTPQAATLLSLLTGRAGELVTREEIRSALWTDQTFVDYEAAVNACVSQIRTALGDSATAPRFLETLPRRGYRFTAPVIPLVPDTTPAAANAPAMPPVLIAAQSRTNYRHAAGMVVLVTCCVALLTWSLNAGKPFSAGENSIAVIPIVSEDDRDRDLIALGNLLQERTLLELQSRSLGRSPILSRMAVDGLRGEARSLEGLRAIGPDYWMEATLQRVGGNVRLHAKGVRFRDLRILWVSEFERPLEIFQTYRDKFAAELAGRLLEATAVRREAALSIESGPHLFDVGAEILLDEADAQAPLELLERAVAAEPHNTAARGLLARALVAAWVSGQRRDDATIERAREEVRVVLGEAPDDVNALAALGGLQLWADWNLRDAGVSLEKAAAARMTSDDARGWRNAWLSATGQLDEAVADARRMVAMTPVSSGAILVRALTLAGRDAEATAAAREANDLRPGSASGRDADFDDAIAAAGRGEVTAAMTLLERAVRSGFARRGVCPGASGTRPAEASAGLSRSPQPRPARSPGSGPHRYEPLTG